MSKVPYQSSLPELIRETETNYIGGSSTTISKYVQWDMLETLNTIDAYLNSKHISGEFDSQGREKPFFNIVTAASNIWYRATDIDRKNIKVRPTNNKTVIDAFLATVYLQEWMRKERFGVFLNEWGRVLARYGSAISKFVENDEGLTPIVQPWNRMIVDQVDFDNNIKIEVIELTEAQLKKKKGYNKEIVKKLCETIEARETVDGYRKDNKNYYVKLYEVHGELPLSYLTGKEEDSEEYVQQMHVVTFVAKKESSKDFDNFTLYSGREKKEPNSIAHLIKEDGRTLGIGAVEHLFQSQWMMNHTVKSIKDQLDLASKLIFQTADGTFIGQNALSAIENGDILIHAPNMPLTQVANTSHDITSLQNYGNMWKQLSNEIAGISESMLGNTAPSGTAWRQVEALLQESRSLFELMTENKGLAIEDMLTTHFIPFVQKKMNNKDQVVATLDSYDIQKIDSIYVKNEATKRANRAILDAILDNKMPTPEDQAMLTGGISNGLQNSLSEMGNQRFFKPDEINWKEQFKDLKWQLEIDITGEQRDVQAAMTTLTTVLKTIASNPAILQDPNAKMVFNAILKETAVLSPLQMSDVAKPTPIQNPEVPKVGGSLGALPVK